jgi:hypothetical protein
MSISKDYKYNEYSTPSRIDKNNGAIQLANNRSLSAGQSAIDAYNEKVIQRKANNSGLPDNLKSGIENLSGHAMDDVKVHYNSDKPAQLNAHAYAQGNDIHLASGQEKHLPHEAWHVVQQKQGRVQPTMQMKGKVNVNDNKDLEKEADIKGSEAENLIMIEEKHFNKAGSTGNVVQKKSKEAFVTISDENSILEGGVLQAKGNITVFLKRGEDMDTIIISNIAIESRVPTSAEGYSGKTKKSGGGDHTVAETLIKSSIKSLIGLPIGEFLQLLQFLIKQNLMGSEKAIHTDPEVEKRAAITPFDLLEEVTAFEIDDVLTLGARLSNLVTIYWRLLEKRDDTAFYREDGLTTGGSEGKDEAAAIIEILNLRTRFLNLGPGEWHEMFSNMKYVSYIIGKRLIDIVPQGLSDDRIFRLCQRASQHCAQIFQIKNTTWINQVAAYIFKEITGIGIGPKKQDHPLEKMDVSGDDPYD